MRVLLVEDDPLLGDGVRAGLVQEGYTVDWVKDGRTAELALKTEKYGLIVLDLGLPFVSGLDVLTKLRKEGDTTPVLVLTARDTVSDRVKGLDSGADDYLVKPFDLSELGARVRAVLRRHTGRAEPVLRHGDIILDPAAHTVTSKGQPVTLLPREFTILKELLENAGTVLSRERLESSIYGWDEEVESNAIEVHIHHLRKKLGSTLINTVRGVGYIIQKPKSS